VNPATPLVLGVVGNVAHWRKSTIGTSKSATVRLESRAMRSTRRVAQYTTTPAAQ